MAEIQKINVGGVDYTLHDTTARSWMNNTAKKSMYNGYNNVNSVANRDIDRNQTGGNSPTFCSFSSGGALLTFNSDNFYRQTYSTSTKNNVVTDTLNARDEMVPGLKKENVKNILIIGNWYGRYTLRSAGNLIFGLNASNGIGNWYSETNWTAGGPNREKIGAVAPNTTTEIRLYGPAKDYMIGASGMYQGLLDSTQIKASYNLCLVHSVGGTVKNIAKSTYVGLSLRVFYFGGYA